MCIFYVDWGKVYDLEGMSKDFLLFSVIVWLCLLVNLIVTLWYSGLVRLRVFLKAFF